MKDLLKHVIEIERSKMQCSSVIVHDVFYDEMCSGDMPKRAKRIYLDLVKLFAINSYKMGEFIDLKSVDDLYSKLRDNQSSNQTNKENFPIEKIENSKAFLDRLKDAIEAYFRNDGGRIKPLRQSELLDFYKNKDGLRISQAGLSNMINRDLRVHVFVINKNYPTYEIVAKTLNPFRRIDFDRHMGDGEFPE